MSPSITVVVLSHNRAATLLATVAHLRALPEQPEIVVVDNRSRDGTPGSLRKTFPDVKLVALASNLGAAGRNVGVHLAQTPYVALCDDDTRWAPGALARACELFDRHPECAVLSARVLVGAAELEDPTCRRMAASPLPSERLPGPALVGFMAGASAVRREAFLAAGGFEPRLFIGGEETLLAMDLLSQGWQIAYAPELTVHHYPSAVRDAGQRRALLWRNAIWTALLRRRLPSALAIAARAAHEAARAGALLALLGAVARGLPWVLRARRPLPRAIDAAYRRVARSEAAAAHAHRSPHTAGLVPRS
ncbi:MAG: glycosyltransferase family 2 protein [Gammaproteobacteria bacterium]|nr:glycosyltransferase family 2 protein [Gammaproteobacteria bacterium]